MYFGAARKGFQEALGTIDPKTDPVRYNLFAGLVALASGLEMQEIAVSNRLQRLEQRLQSLEAKPPASP